MAALIKLMSSDERTFEVPVKVAKMSLTIMDLLESLVLDHDHDDPIFLPNVTGQILEKFLKWATHHQVNSTQSQLLLVINVISMVVFEIHIVKFVNVLITG